MAFKRSSVRFRLAPPKFEGAPPIWWGPFDFKYLDLIKYHYIELRLLQKVLYWKDVIVHELQLTTIMSRNRSS